MEGLSEMTKSLDETPAFRSSTVGGTIGVISGAFHGGAIFIAIDKGNNI